MPDIDKETITTRRITVVFTREEAEDVLHLRASDLIGEELPLEAQSTVTFNWNERADQISSVTVVLQTIKRDDG